MGQSTQSKRAWEITIDSNWIMTIGMAVLLAICGVLLLREIRGFIFGQVVEPEQLARDLPAKTFTIIAGLYCFLFAFGFRAKSLKIAFVLVGARLASGIGLTLLHVSSGVRHFAAVAESVALQIALAIFIVAIVQWFKSVAHWVPPSHSGEADT